MSGGDGARLVAQNVSRGSLLGDALEAAPSFLGRFRGLMLRPPLPAGGGLWLPETNGIHMLFMRYALDCVFLGRPEASGGERRIVGLRRALPAWRGVVWYVRGAHGVLELPVGAIDASGTAIGDLIRLEPADGGTATA